ncbi:hypothetical protein MMC26_004879 [Xylographa opegraphella]|nr:hypothetical protein [Xylographa opegraphella]
MAANCQGTLLGLTFDQWMAGSFKNGIMAVIDRWGIPGIYKKHQRKEELMVIAWHALLSFNPPPHPPDVQMVIGTPHPGPQDRAPRKPAAKKKEKPTVAVPNTPKNRNTPKTPKTPKNPDTPQNQGSASGTDPYYRGRPSGTGNTPQYRGAAHETDIYNRGRPTGVGQANRNRSSSSSSDLSTASGGSQETPSRASRVPTSGTNQGTPLEGPPTKTEPNDFNIVKTALFSINNPIHDPQLEDGLGLIAANFPSQLSGLLSRYFHRDMEASRGEAEELPPLRPISDFAELDELLLADVFDNVHDPCVTSYSVAFRDWDTRDYLPDKGSRSYSCRGRGPIWSRTSCALDAVLVAAKLLDIGRISADTGFQTWQDWAMQHDEFQRACLRIFHEHWNILTRDESIRRRDRFYHEAIAYGREHKTRLGLNFHGALQSSLTTWDLCTKPANQFTFGQFSRTFCPGCEQQTRLFPGPDEQSQDHPTGTEQRDITFDELSEDSNERPDMQEMLQRHFDPLLSHKSHHGCTAPIDVQVRTSTFRRRIVNDMDLPKRLVVKPALHYRDIPGASSDNITFSYTTLAGEQVRRNGPWRQKYIRKRTATYRWLGGIYHYKQHYRVYWQDSAYVISNGNVKVYDGQLFHGAIVGDMPPCEPGFKVPSQWSQGTDVLFYERINDLDRDAVISRAQALVQGLADKPEVDVAAEEAAAAEAAATEEAAACVAAMKAGKAAIHASADAAHAKKVAKEKKAAKKAAKEAAAAASARPWLTLEAAPITPAAVTTRPWPTFGAAPTPGATPTPRAPAPGATPTPRAPTPRAPTPQAPAPQAPTPQAAEPQAAAQPAAGLPITPTKQLTAVTTSGKSTPVAKKSPAARPSTSGPRTPARSASATPSTPSGQKRSADRATPEEPPSKKKAKLPKLETVRESPETDAQ